MAKSYRKNDNCLELISITKNEDGSRPLFFGVVRVRLVLYSGDNYRQDNLCFLQNSIFFSPLTTHNWGNETWPMLTPLNFEAAPISQYKPIWSAWIGWWKSVSAPWNWNDRSKGICAPAKCAAGRTKEGRYAAERLGAGTTLRRAAIYEIGGENQRNLVFTSWTVGPGNRCCLSRLYFPAQFISKPRPAIGGGFVLWGVHHGKNHPK